MWNMVNTNMPPYTKKKELNIMSHFETETHEFTASVFNYYTFESRVVASIKVPNRPVAYI